MFRKQYEMFMTSMWERVSLAKIEDVETINMLVNTVTL